MKRIITLISIALAIVSCEKPIGGPVPEPGYDYFSVVRFREIEYPNYILAYKFLGNWGCCGGTWDGRATAYSTPNVLYSLNKDYFVSNHESVLDARELVLTNKKKSEWNEKLQFQPSEFLTTSPFSACYMLKRGQFPYYIEFPLSESDTIVKFLNALIDSGSIEQYRVDLGY